MVRKIKRYTRRKFNSEEKIRIILESLRGEDSIANICRKEGIAPSIYYKWNKAFLEAGKRQLGGDTSREANREEVSDLRSENAQLKQLVEGSPVSVKQTLSELNINCSTFYSWYKSYGQGGPEALKTQYHPSEQFWNEIPLWEKKHVVETALDHPEKSPRELAWHITDEQGYHQDNN